MPLRRSYALSYGPYPVHVCPNAFTVPLGRLEKSYALRKGLTTDLPAFGSTMWNGYSIIAACTVLMVFAFPWLVER